MNNLAPHHAKYFKVLELMQVSFTVPFLIFFNLLFFYKNSVVRPRLKYSYFVSWSWNILHLIIEKSISTYRLLLFGHWSFIWKIAYKVVINVVKQYISNNLTWRFVCCKYLLSFLCNYFNTTEIASNLGMTKNTGDTWHLVNGRLVFRVGLSSCPKKKKNETFFKIYFYKVTEGGKIQKIK